MLCAPTYPQHPSHMLSGRLTSMPSRQIEKRIDYNNDVPEEKPRQLGQSVRLSGSTSAVVTVCARVFVLRSCRWAGKVVITMWKWSLPNLKVRHVFVYYFTIKNSFYSSFRYKVFNSANVHRMFEINERTQKETFQVPRSSVKSTRIDHLARRDIFWRSIISWKARDEGRWLFNLRNIASVHL